MWIVQVNQSAVSGHDEWLPEEQFQTPEQVTGYMWRVSKFFVPDVDDTLLKGGNPVVQFRVKWVPDKS